MIDWFTPQIGTLELFVWCIFAYAWGIVVQRLINYSHQIRKVKSRKC